MNNLLFEVNIQGYSIHNESLLHTATSENIVIMVYFIIRISIRINRPVLFY